MGLPRSYSYIAIYRGGVGPRQWRRHSLAARGARVDEAFVACRFGWWLVAFSRLWQQSMIALVVDGGGGGGGGQEGDFWGIVLS